MAANTVRGGLEPRHFSNVRQMVAIAPIWTITPLIGIGPLVAARPKDPMSKREAASKTGFNRGRLEPGDIRAS